YCPRSRVPRPLPACSCPPAQRPLHSFPTRRSSDLPDCRHHLHGRHHGRRHRHSRCCRGRCRHDLRHRRFALSPRPPRRSLHRHRHLRPPLCHLLPRPPPLPPLTPPRISRLSLG